MFVCLFVCLSDARSLAEWGTLFPPGANNCLTRLANKYCEDRATCVRVGRNPGGSILPLLGTQDRNCESPPDDATIPFNPIDKHPIPGAVIITQHQFRPQIKRG